MYSKSNNMLITKEDVISVSNDINISLNEEQINQVLEMYESEENNDPTGTWNLIIENCIINLVR